MKLFVLQIISIKLSFDPYFFYWVITTSGQQVTVHLLSDVWSMIQPAWNSKYVYLKILFASFEDLELQSSCNVSWNFVNCTHLCANFKRRLLRLKHAPAPPGGLSTVLRHFFMMLESTEAQTVISSLLYRFTKFDTYIQTKEGQDESRVMMGCLCFNVKTEWWEF